MPQTPLPKLNWFDPRGLGPRATFYILICLMALVLSSGIVIRRNLDKLVKVDDEALIDTTADFVVGELGHDDSNEILREITTHKRVPAALHKRVYVTLYDQAGRFVASNVKIENFDGFLLPELSAAMMTANDTPLQIETAHGRSFSYRVVKFSTVHNHFFGVFSVDHDLERGIFVALERMFIGIIGTALIVVLILAFLVTRSVLLPLKRLSDHVSQFVQPTRNASPIDASGYPVDFMELIAAYNRMVRRIDDSFKRLAAFSSNIAHELRTPINNILGEMQVALGKPRESEEYQQVLYSSMEEVQRVQAITQSLLLLARNESGGSLNGQPMRLQQELFLIVDFYLGLAEEKKLTFSVLCDKSLGIYGDRTLLQQAIGNLLSNAIRYSPGNSVIEVLAISDSPEFCKISISNSGPSIPHEQLAFVFDRFYRGDHARASNQGGVGLGLAIVKSIVECHGGKVEAQSSPGVGTSFFVWWPKGAGNIS